MRSSIHSNRGYTLIELMISCAVLVLIFTGSFMALDNFVKAHLHQENMMQARQALRVAATQIASELRLASRASLAIDADGRLVYQLPKDLNGDGVLLNADGEIELGPARTMGIDFGDANGDGIGRAQVLVSFQEGSRVLANRIYADRGEIIDPNAGFQFELRDGGVRFAVVTQVAGSPSQQRTFFVAPRNP